MLQGLDNQLSLATIFQNARDFLISQHVCNHKYVLNPCNLSQRLLSFINQNNLCQDGALIDAMSQYLKLMPDQGDLDAAFNEDSLDQIDS